MLKNPRLRLGATLWLLAMIGVVVLALTVLPQLLAKSHQQISLTVAITASVVQSGVLLLLAVWVGGALSKPLGLGAPAIEAALSGSGGWPALKGANRENGKNRALRPRKSNESLGMSWLKPCRHLDRRGKPSSVTHFKTT